MSDEHDGDMKHKSYIETVKQLVTAGWGKQFPTDKDAQQDLLKSMDLSGACLMALISRVEAFLDALTNSEIEVRRQRMKLVVESQTNKWVDWRVDKHGPMPNSVYYWVQSKERENLGRCLESGGWSLRNIWFDTCLPEKGTQARREYDAWMRRKAKSQAKQPSHAD